MSEQRSRAGGVERLKAAVRRLRQAKARPQAPAAAWGSDEWHLSVEQRLAALEARARTDRVSLIVMLALLGALERLEQSGALARVLEAIK